MFQFTGFAPHCGNVIAYIGLPHSDIFGSMFICNSPKLVAAYHVFHRLLKPRHPPSALDYFLCNVFFIFCWSALLMQCRCCSCDFTNFVQSCQRSFVTFVTSWRISGSNWWPPACRAGALANWDNPPAAIYNKLIFYCLCCLVDFEIYWFLDFEIY